MNNKEKIRKYLDELKNTIVAADLNYQIWWIYRGPFRKKYVDILNKYPHFFLVSIHAHFVALIIALYRLFEKRSNKYTINFHDTVKLFEEEGILNPEKLELMNEKVESAKEIWIKVSVLRNECFGHLNKNVINNELEPFKKAKVTPDDLKKLIDYSKDILNELASEFGRFSYAFNLSSENDTIRLLDDLLEEVRYMYILDQSCH